MTSSFISDAPAEVGPLSKAVLEFTEGHLGGTGGILEFREYLQQGFDREVGR